MARRALLVARWAPLVALAHNSSAELDRSSTPIAGLVSSTEKVLPSTKTKTGDSFQIIYNNHTRNPHVVVEKLSRSSFTDAPSESAKRPPFFADKHLDESFKVLPKDFCDSNFDRGHLVPAADFSYDLSAFGGTFTLANISPQAPLLNKGAWASGPVFAPTFVNNQWIYVHRTVGTFPRLITVPSHFYKVIIGKKSDGGTTVIAAFLMPNIDDVNKDGPVSSFLVSLDQLESVVGYKFLPYLDDAVKKRLDTFVPASRDLTNVLNAQKLLQTAEGKPVQLQDVGKTTNKTAPNQVVKDVVKAIVPRSAGMLHLCECVDCGRSMLGGKKQR